MLPPTHSAPSPNKIEGELAAVAWKTNTNVPAGIDEAPSKNESALMRGRPVVPRNAPRLNVTALRQPRPAAPVLPHGQAKVPIPLPHTFFENARFNMTI